MSDLLKDLPRRGMILLLAAIAAGLGVPGPLAASQSITCEMPPLLTSSPQPSAQLGWSLSADGGWLAAGANRDNRHGEDSGVVALYLHPQPAVQQQPDQEIAADDSHPGDQFGSSVSISGNWLAVGAPVGDGKVRDSGVVYLFQLSPDGSTWAPRQPKLEATDAAKGSQFGSSVSLNVSLSGTTLVVGAPGDSDRGSGAGAAYVFELQGGIWTQTKLVAGDGRAFDEFGFAVATSGDEIVVGAPFADDFHALENFGAAYVFKKTPNKGWSLEENGKLTAGPFRPGNIQFGSAVAIGGGEIAVGAPGDDQHITDSGSAYVFEWNGSDWKPYPFNPLTVDDPKLGAQLGTSLQIDGDANHILIGAPFDSSSTGAAYLFEFDKQSASWIQSSKFLPTHSGAFGQSVALLGSQVFMGGVDYNMGDATHAGAVATCSIPPLSNPHLTCANMGPKSVDAGGFATYTITVTNDGNTAVTGIMLDDPTPPHLELVRADKPCDRKFPCSLGTIPLGESVSKKVTFQVPEDCSARGPIHNTATVKADGMAALSCPAPPTAIVSLPQKPFLSCDKQGPASVRAGDTITYQLTVSNSGCAAANNVQLSDGTPPGLTYLSGPCVQSSCNLGTIGPGQSLPPVTVKFKASNGCAAPTSITNTATVTGSQATSQTCSLVTSVTPKAPLGISVSAPAQVSGGDSFTVTVVVTNAGPSTAEGATADVVLGPSAIVAPPTGCTAVPNQINHFTCHLANLLPCGSKSLDFAVSAPVCVGCTAGNPIAVTAQAMSQTSTPTNVVTATVQVICPPIPLSITQTDSPDPVVPGQGVVYDITVKNAGTSAVTGAVVRDDFPSELQGVRWCRGAGCTPNLFPPLADTIDLAAGETRIYRLSGIVQPMCSAVLHNKATITPPAGFCGAPSESVEDTQVAATGVHAFCEGISGPLTELSQMTQTYLLINCGPANQTDNPGDEFTDTLPAGLTLVSASATSGTALTSGNTVTWNGAIPVGGTVTITLTATINAGTTGMTLCNQATINYDADGDGTNESSRLSDDPDEPGAADPCCFRVTPPIPTLSGSGLAALTLLLAGLAILRLRRRPL